MRFAFCGLKRLAEASMSAFLRGTGRDDGILRFRNFIHGLKIAGRGNGKPGLDDIDAHFVKQRAMRSFSSRFIEQPGDCSPSRKVVSKMMTRLLLISAAPRRPA
jgi:hypothetical protein